MYLWRYPSSGQKQIWEESERAVLTAPLRPCKNPVNRLGVVFLHQSHPKFWTCGWSRRLFAKDAFRPEPSNQFGLVSFIVSGGNDCLNRRKVFSFMACQRRSKELMCDTGRGELWKEEGKGERERKRSEFNFVVHHRDLKMILHTAR